MSEFRRSGVYGFFTQDLIDDGTLCRCASPLPGPLGIIGGYRISPEIEQCSDGLKWVMTPIQRAARRQSVIGGFDPATMVLGPDGIALLKAVETLRLKPYDDQTGLDISAWVAGATIGYGHLIAAGEWTTYKGGITEPQADALFAADLAPFEQVVRDSITVGLQQYQFDALVILAFNIGEAGFKSSSVVKLVNDPNAVTGYTSLESAWKAWNKSQGKVMKGLDNRRAAEWRIYTGADYSRW